MLSMVSTVVHSKLVLLLLFMHWLVLLQLFVGGVVVLCLCLVL